MFNQSVIWFMISRLSHRDATIYTCCLRSDIAQVQTWLKISTLQLTQHTGFYLQWTEHFCVLFTLYKYIWVRCKHNVDNIQAGFKLWTNPWPVVQRSSVETAVACNSIWCPILVFKTTFNRFKPQLFDVLTILLNIATSYSDIWSINTVNVLHLACTIFGGISIFC